MASRGIEHTRGMAIDRLNDAKMDGDPQSKVNKLMEVTELVVNKEPALLSEFIGEFMVLQADPAQAVRKYL
eukprot:CAMPEP_0182895966 /NCGR_PEP_ID=MMETSP0034_2-20130328/25999_1 /TAXON_ID=156128 /ORGANISM="Nephroselmis pyriformis, Strain CCMP717" /LENGTH=70 /DNA_ID=CAMNT_0025029823 /DNA_START=87 /DNA_END=296 /DNA_ORIENTATION=+